MNNTLKSTFFWRIYLLLEENSVDHDRANEELYYLLLEIKDRFPVVKNTEGYESETVYFNFYCSETYQLQIEFKPDVFGGDTYIYLLKDEEKLLLGWSDHAHWHPYFLRIQELDLISEYLKKFDDKWIDSDIPFLLLFSFLCITDEKIEEYVKKKIKVIFNSFNPKLVSMVEKDFHILYRVRKGYYWQLDSELDWVVLADEYGPYSLRNKLYEEHKFPFKEWKNMITQIEQALNINQS
jgi:hypothetical protein